MRRPVLLAIGAVAGALAIEAAAPAVVSLAGAAVMLAAVAASRTASGRRAAPLVVVALGVVGVGLRGALAGAPPATAGIPAGAGPWRAVVTAVSAPRDGQQRAFLRLEDPPVVLAATLPWYPAVMPSDRVAVSGQIRPPPDTAYGDYLRTTGAGGSIRVDALELLAPTEGPSRTLEVLRRAAADGLRRAVPEPEAGLATGVLIGLRDRVDRDLAAAFTTAGASHVVAISGWNIAIVASTVAGLFGRARRRRRSLLTLLAIAAYVAFVGPSPSVVRAAVMAAVALLAREAGRPGTAMVALGWAVTMLLLTDPAMVHDPGFRLSVLATAGIVAWGTGLTARLAGTGPGRVRRWLAEILGVSLAAQAATLPVVLLDFGRLSLVAPLVNVGIVPLVPLAMASSLLALGGGLLAVGLPGWVAAVAGLPAWFLYAVMVAIVRAGAGLPLASISLPPPWDAIAGAVSGVAIIVLARWTPPRRARDRLAKRAVRPVTNNAAQSRSAGPATQPAQQGKRGAAPNGRSSHNRAIGVVAAASIALALVIVHRPDGLTRVVVLDVGQGDGILVEGARGGRLLVDGGPDPARLVVALDERLPPWDHRIDVLVLTHPHEDHVAGLAELLGRYRVGRVYEPGMRGPGPGYAAWATELARGGPAHGTLAAGDHLAIDDIRLQVLWPDAGRVPDEPPDDGTGINNVSIVLLGTVGAQRFLLAGDVEQEVDPELLRRSVPRVDLLKVAHHGSRTASTQAFLEAVHPTVAVVSAGRGNPYGHPAPSTIERLEGIARRTYRTDTDGTVEVTFDGTTLRVHRSGARAAAGGTTAATPAVAPVPGVIGTPAAGVVRASPMGAFTCAVPQAETDGLLADAARPRLPVRIAPPLPSALPPSRGGASSEPTTARPGAPPARAPSIGGQDALGYHRDGGTLASLGDRAGAAAPSAGLLLGRRRVLHRHRGRGVQDGPAAVPRRRPAAMAAGVGADGPRPPPRGAPGTPGDGVAVRRRQRGDRERRGHPRSPR